MTDEKSTSENSHRLLGWNRQQAVIRAQTGTDLAAWINAPEVSLTREADTDLRHSSGARCQAAVIPVVSLEQFVKQCGIQFVAGADITYSKHNPQLAVCVLVVLDFKSCELVHHCTVWATREDLECPYIPGYLAFREAPLIERALNELRAERPDLCTGRGDRPQVLLLDGNGQLHPERAGLACHVGVQSKICSIGVAKNLHEICGITKELVRAHRSLQPAADVQYLIGETGLTLGAALYPSAPAQNPVYVSVGHLMTLDVAILICMHCMKYRVPEPTRLADIIGRELMRGRQASK